MAAVNLEAMSNVPGNCHELKGDRKFQLAIYLDKTYRLIFKPNHNPIPIYSQGGLDREKVTDIEILEIIDYH